MRLQSCKSLNDLNLEDTYININSKYWKEPKTLSLDNIGGLLSVNISEELNQKNVTCVEYSNQDKNPELPPETYNVDIKTHIAIDDNYLYVWIKSLKKWKRIILSNWEL